MKLNFEVMEVIKNEAKVKFENDIYLVGRCEEVANKEYGYYKQRLEIDEYGRETWVGARWDPSVFAKNLAQALLEAFYDYKNNDSPDYQWGDPISLKELQQEIKTELKRMRGVVTCG